MLDGIAHLVLDRPEKLNALDEPAYAALADAIRDAATERDLRFLVIRGEGRAFCAGNDLADLAKLVEEPDFARTKRPALLEASALLERLGVPTVCQIHGVCLGGGLELALACDFRVVAHDAALGLPETRIGLIPDLGGLSRLPAMVGLGRATDLVMTGRVIDGREAHRIGLASRVAPAAHLPEETGALCDEMLGVSITAVVHARQILHDASMPIRAATLDLEGVTQELLARTGDFAAQAALLHPAPSGAGTTRRSNE
jgi:enoyl-CoA hydratase/carnithine racemase